MKLPPLVPPLKLNNKQAGSVFRCDVVNDVHAKSSSLDSDSCDGRSTMQTTQRSEGGCLPRQKQKSTIGRRDVCSKAKRQDKVDRRLFYNKNAAVMNKYRKQMAKRKGPSDIYSDRLPLLRKDTALKSMNTGLIVSSENKLRYTICIAEDIRNADLKKRRKIPVMRYEQKEFNDLAAYSVGRSYVM